MKGQISVIEVGISLSLLLLFVYLIFSFQTYESKWADARILLEERDLILSLDRANKLYTYTFDSSKLNEFVKKITKGLTAQITFENAYKPILRIACNCSKERIDELNNLTGRIVVNGRNLNLVFVETTLEDIVPSDLLLIWSNKTLDPYYTNLKNYLKKAGIIEVADFYSDSINDDRVQTQIFGLQFNSLTSTNTLKANFSRNPSTIEDEIYPLYKHFYHLSFLSFPRERVSEIPTCEFQFQPKGELIFNQTNYTYWICDENSIWLDSNANGTADLKVQEGEEFQLAGNQLILSKVENTSISIKFKKPHYFQNFLPKNAYILDAEDPRILLKSLDGIPLVIVNKSTAWIADFGREGRLINEDEKALLISLILALSNKKSEKYFEGLSTSYLNVKNEDLLEIYSLEFTLIYPY